MHLHSSDCKLPVSSLFVMYFSAEMDSVRVKRAADLHCGLWKGIYDAVCRYNINTFPIKSTAQKCFLCFPLCVCNAYDWSLPLNKPDPADPLQPDSGSESYTITDRKKEIKRRDYVWGHILGGLGKCLVICDLNISP